MEIWFTSDTHWGHKNICAYSGRPYDSLEQHDEALIQLWNERVKPGDMIYHLGDVAFYRKQAQVEGLLSRLKGQKVLIRGNHDHKAVRKANGWAQVLDYKEIKVDVHGVKQHIVLFHYPMQTWHQAHHGSWALHGHCHGTLPENLGARTFDVGVDCWNYAPISLEEVAAKMENHTYEPVDHHGRPFPAGVHQE